MNVTILNSFLKFGYFLNYTNSDYSIDLSNVNKSRYADMSEDELICCGIREWKNALTNCFNSSDENIVPVSGGLDSRAILAGLLEFSEARDIQTYTFGTPGTLDYDIGNTVAKSTGTRHTSFSLDEYSFSLDEELDISKRVDQQTVLFHHPPIWIMDDRYGLAKFWLGFMGDPLAGSHLSDVPCKTLQEAKHDFIRRNTYAKSIDCITSDDKDFFPFIDDRLFARDLLTIEEQLDFQNRQLKFVAPHVMIRGYDYKLPFLQNNWVTFMLSVDNKYRYDQNLYKKILVKAYPELFSLPTKNLHGLPLNSSRLVVRHKQGVRKLKRTLNRLYPIFKAPDTNYIDFDEGIRHRKDLKKIIRENILDLKQRRIVDWVNIESLWTQHMNRKSNHGNALLTLASLEMHLKTGKIIS